MATRRGESIIRKLKRNKILTFEDATRNFIETWCHKCGIIDLLSGADLEDVNTLCPKETIDTCPFYLKYQATESVSRLRAPTSSRRQSGDIDNGDIDTAHVIDSSDDIDINLITSNLASPKQHLLRLKDHNL